MTVRPETHPCGQRDCKEPHPYLVEGADGLPAFCAGPRSEPIDLPVHRDGAAVRPPGRRFDEVLREAFDAGAQWALGRTVRMTPEAEAARADGFREWREGQLP